MKGTWRPVDHTGDVAIDAEAPTEEDLFACCAAALFEILAEPLGPGPRREAHVSAEAPDDEVLMVRWLRELLYLHSTERWIFAEFEVALEGGEGAGRRLSGIARGEIFDPERHDIRTELKAVTYHQIRVGRDGDLWRARVVFDV
jgi:SHS2 domain-containing protein